MSTYRSWKFLFAFLACLAATTVTVSAGTPPQGPSKRSSHGSADYAIQVLGQDAAGKPNFFTKMKTGITNFFKDEPDGPHAHHEHGAQQNGGSDSGKPSPQSRATRVTPPKPVTVDAVAETTPAATSPTPRPTPSAENTAATRQPASRREVTAFPSNESRPRNENFGHEAPRGAGMSREQSTALLSTEQQESGDELIQNRMERLRRMREKTATSRKSPEEVNREAMEQLTQQNNSQVPTPPRDTTPQRGPVRTGTPAPSDTVVADPWENLAPEPERRPVKPLLKQENANEFLQQRSVGAGEPSRGTTDSMSLSERMEWARSQQRTRSVPEDTPIREHGSHAGSQPLAHESRSFPQAEQRPAREDGLTGRPEQHAETPDRLAMHPGAGHPLIVESSDSHGPTAGRVDVVHGGAPQGFSTQRSSATPSERNPRSAVPQVASRQTSTTRRSVQGGTTEPPAAASTSFSGASERITVDVAEDNEKSLLISPLLEVETIGPQRVIVGQESPYQIRLFNRGGVTAEQVVLHVDLPAWIDILPPEVSAGGTSVSSTTPQGTTSQGAAAEGAKTFHWKIDRIDPRSEEQLILHLVPKERKSFNLKLHYDFKRVSAIAPVEVQEPKLEMEIEGPNEILWGNEEIYKLRIRNTGNGDAEKIRLALLPGNVEGQGNEESCTLDLLKAGEEITVDVRAKALQNDFLDINIVANGPFDLQARTMRRVNVLRAELDLVIESPELLFVGSHAEYTLRVRNIGNAPSGPAELLALVPLGAHYISNTGGGRSTPQKEVIWNIESIPVGGEFTASVVCELKRQGVTKLDVSVDDGTGLVVSMQGQTQVESIADLKMKIENPQGPVEVGTDAVYTILVTNNGTRAAEGVDIDAMFSNDIDPIGFEGLAGEITGNGHVLFERIPTISPGQTITLKVRAKATQAGNHKIRVELGCDSTGLQLVHEESTYYYVRRGNKFAASTKPTATAMLTAQPLPVGTPVPAVPDASASATPSDKDVPAMPALPAPFAAEPMPLPW